MIITKFINIILVTLVSSSTESTKYVYSGDLYVWQCGHQPNITYEGCCIGYDKVFPAYKYKNVVNTCKGTSDYCCLLYNNAKELGLLKNNKVDSDTAIDSLQENVDDDKKWIEARFFFWNLIKIY